MPAIGQDLAQPWIQTPAFLEDRARRVHAGLSAMNEALDALVRARRLATDALKYRQWKALLANWGKWYGETGPTTWLWSGTDATLESYELAIRDWTAWFQRTFPDAAGSLPKPPPHYGGDGPRMDVPGWLIGVAAAGGAFLLYKMLK